MVSCRLIVIGLAAIAMMGTVSAQASALPRLGNWMWPGKDAEKLKKLQAIGVGFTSSYDLDTKVGQSLLEAGIVTNLCPNRPSGAQLIEGLGLTAEDMDQDSQGRRTGEGFETAIFSEAVPERFCTYLADRIRPLQSAPWVASVLVSSPISMYGEVHYPASTGGHYAVFGRTAKTNFRNWLKRAYNNDLSALSLAWGDQIASWDEIVPPDGQKAGPEGIDTSRRWSDFIHWYNWWLDEITWRSLQTARQETSKPIATMIGGPKVGFSQGILLGNVGPVVRMLGKLRPALFNDTDGQTLFSTRYTRAACSQYGVELMQEHTGPPNMQPYWMSNMVLNVLSCGADHVHLAHLGELFDDNHWFSRACKDLAPVMLRYHAEHPKSDAVIFHSYMTSWYRPSRSNPDAVNLYDSTNTLWTPRSGYPSWGRALGSPDVVDDAMIEDGALNGRKLLVIPNSSVTVTSRKAVEAIREWVKGGGTVIGFGEGCLAYTVEADRSVTATPGMAGLMSAPSQAILSSVEGGRRPASTEQAVGKGRAVLFLTPADPAVKDSSGKRFVDEMMPVLSTEADRAGVRRWCWADRHHLVNLIYCGRDLKSGRHLFAADFTRKVTDGPAEAVFYSDRTFEFTFDASLKGEAELVGITDSFRNVQGGRADCNRDTNVLTVRFKLPGKLIVSFGKNRRCAQASPSPLNAH